MFVNRTADYKNNSNILELSRHVIEEKSTVTKNVSFVSSDISYDTFFKSFLYCNIPCVIKLQKILCNWPCQNWVINGKPNYDFLKEKYGSCSVPVANCKEKYYNSQKKTNMQFSDYINYWKDCNNDKKYECLYLKDWHFTKDFSSENVYQVPCYFASDWINEYLTQNNDYNDDYRFVYMGPKGSWTPFHVDVFTSFSWSVNICGSKRWLLFPPGEENNFRDKFGNLAYDVTSSELPNYKDSSVFYDIIQREAEAIFIPSGWHHQVWNLEDTISINHNWINGCNINEMWKSLYENLLAVKKEISDCKDMENWEEHCQIMLKATYGVNYQDFYNLLEFIAKRRLEFLQHGKEFIVFGGWKFGKEHTIFDLLQIQTVLKSFLTQSEKTNFLNDENKTLLNLIESVLSSFT